MNCKQVLFLLAITLTLLCASCNQQIDVYGHSTKKKIICADSTIYFSVIYRALTESENSVDERYYSYRDEKIRSSQGYPEGYPLNGKYLVYSNNGSLVEKGQFNNGLRVGHWYRWDSEGDLRSILVFKKGKLSGKQFRFFKERKHKIIETYHYGLLDGKVTEYFADSVIRIDYYDKGEKVNRGRRIHKSGDETKEQ